MRPMSTWKSMQILLLMIGYSFRIVCWQPEPPCSSSNYLQAAMLERPGSAQADSALSHPPLALPAFPLDVPDVGVRRPFWKWTPQSPAIQDTSSPRHRGTSHPCLALSAFLAHRICRHNKVVHVYTAKFTMAPYTRWATGMIVCHRRCHLVTGLQVKTER